VSATAVPPRVDPVAACDSPKLLNVALWPKQRDLLAAIAGPAWLHVWALGRRSGKTTMAAVVLLWFCLFRPDLDRFMRPGERRYAVGVATNLRQAKLLVAAALSIVERSPLLRRKVEAATDEEIRFTNGTALAAFPCNSRGGRGWPICVLVMDEAAHFLSETDGPAVATRVFEALVPATAQFGPEARVILSSTPYGQAGLFAETFHRVDGGELEDARAFRVATAEMNPTIDGDYLARELQRDPDSFRAEYLAEFVGSGAAFLDPERLQKAVADRAELPRDACTDWTAGLDPAFTSDPFGLALVGRSAQRRSQLRLGLVRAWAPRRGGESFDERRMREDEVLDEVATVCLSYGVRRVVTDQYAAQPIVARLRGRGLQVETLAMTASSKTAVFMDLRSQLYTGGLELYEHPGLLAELRRLRTRFSAGSAAVVNPRVGGSHGDMAQALALAVHDLGKGSFAPAGLVSVPPGRSSGGTGSQRDPYGWLGSEFG
jgi:phage terminase large subunit-like protein